MLSSKILNIQSSLNFDPTLCWLYLKELWTRLGESAAMVTDPKKSLRRKSMRALTLGELSRGAPGAG